MQKIISSQDAVTAVHFLKRVSIEQHGQIQIDFRFYYFIFYYHISFLAWGIIFWQIIAEKYQIN